MALKDDDTIEAQTTIQLQELADQIADLSDSTIYNFISTVLLAMETKKADEILKRLCRNK